MVNEDFSCIKLVTKNVNLTLPSMYNTNEISGICDALDSWKRQYVKQLQGIVVGYKNVSLTSKRGYIKVDCPVIYCNVNATFELFYPTIGSIIKGKVNRICQDYIGCLVHDTINVTVYRTSDLSTDIFECITLDQIILFQITRINFKSKFINVKGKITEECITLMKESGLFTDKIDLSDKNLLTCSSPDFSSSSIDSNVPSVLNNNVQNAISSDASLQNSSHKKKKKHKKSRENFSLSPSLVNESFKNNVDNVELSQTFLNTKKRKHKIYDVDFALPSNVIQDGTESVQPKQRIKTEEPIIHNSNQIELMQFSDDNRKRKRKKSDSNLASSINVIENESMHPKKKRKIGKHISVNDTMQFLENNSSLMSSDTFSSENNICPTSPVITSSNKSTGVKDSVIKSELSSPAKKKTHKKSKSSLEASSSFSGQNITTEVNYNDSSSFAHTSSQKMSPSSCIKSEEYSLASPDFFDTSVNEVKSEADPVKKKKKKITFDKSKSHKKKKDKHKKGSKKDKKKKTKVISSKKKVHGHKTKLKKKTNKDKKSKSSKKSKPKSD